MRDFSIPPFPMKTIPSTPRLGIIPIFAMHDKGRSLSKALKQSLFDDRTIISLRCGMNGYPYSHIVASKELSSTRTPS
jgi:hypothetical protein